MTIRARSIAILVIGLILGGVLLLQLVGLWNTEGKKVPTKIESGEAAGMSDPAAIKGSYTFGDIQTHFLVPAETIARAYAIDTSSQDVSTFQAKSIEERYAEAEGLVGDIGTDSVRLFVALYAGLPYEPEEDTFLPSSAMDVLLDEGRISTGEADAFADRIFLVSTVEPVIAPPPVVSEGTSAEAALVKGNTTFEDLLDWGLTKAQIEVVLGNAMPATGLTVRDYLAQQGLEFSSYKLELQRLLDTL
ncbi:hypothetical protein [Pleomorphochaeta sp. DL1XJH-081]|uniref:hypothetical protein n=1 Tax=Pleomorphochaeta sp. DL1XJH-081 TaxID=3409690 RepID=UPI003BB6B7B1